MEKKQLAAFLSFFTITFDAVNEKRVLQCDCDLYQFREFIQVYGEGRKLLETSRAQHLTMFGQQDFLTWRCQVENILGGEIKGLFEVHDDLFICKFNKKSKWYKTCPHKCTCFTRHIDGSILVDCSNMSSFPLHVPFKANSSLTVRLRLDSTTTLPSCDNKPGYDWLKHVTKLDIENSYISANDVTEMEAFLKCLFKIEELYLSGNDINRLPMYIRSINFTQLSISQLKLQCCRPDEWMKKWLQDSKHIVIKYSLITCSYPIASAYTAYRCSVCVYTFV